MPMPDEISVQIQDISGNPRLTNRQKVEKIDSLKGASKEEKFDFLNKNLRMWPGLSEEVAKFVSKGSKKDK